jgi:hypothetical protein
MMNEILQNLIDQEVIVYIDNIMIYAYNMKQYEILVKKVLSRLHVWNLTVSIHKYHFHMDIVDFLGYIISRDASAMSEKKVNAIRSWESPKTQKNLQAFMGFLNFYERCIENFSKIVKPLTDLTKEEFKRTNFQ